VGYIRSSAEIDAIRRVYARPRFGPGEQLAITFRTDESAYRRLLPPLLEPADEPIASVSVGRWRSNCIGDFTGGNLTLRARYLGVEGAYPLTIWMNTTYSVDLGRDHFGEPKKLAHASIRREGDTLRGHVERFGVRVIDAEVDLGPDLGPKELERFTYNYRARLTPDGDHLDGDAVLTRTRVLTTARSRYASTGRLVLRASPFDPVDEVPIEEILGAEYQQHTMDVECESIASVPAEQFLPFHLGRIDDPLLLNTERSAGEPAESVV
jgi:acetoacetate decarboxylase